MSLASAYRLLQLVSLCPALKISWVWIKPKCVYRRGVGTSGDQVPRPIDGLISFKENLGDATRFLVIPRIQNHQQRGGCTFILLSPSSTQITQV